MVPGPVAHVEAPETEGQVADVEGRQPVLEVGGQGIALLAPLVGAAGVSADPPELGVELGPHLLEALVEPLDVGALRLEIVGAGRSLPAGICVGQVPSWRARCGTRTDKSASWSGSTDPRDRVRSHKSVRVGWSHDLLEDHVVHLIGRDSRENVAIPGRPGGRIVLISDKEVGNYSTGRSS